jgi:hypothetical protein
MSTRFFLKHLFSLGAIAALVVMPAAAMSALRAPQGGPNITVQGNIPAKVSRGRAARASVTMTIPAGYHANANKASESYLIPTTLTVTGPAGVNISAVSYPTGIMKTFSFSNGKPLRVYEGRVPMSFTVTVPANYAGGEVVLNARVRVQSCDDKTCFAPRNIDTQLKAAL